MTTSSAEPRDVNIRFRYYLGLNNPPGGDLCEGASS